MGKQQLKYTQMTFQNFWNRSTGLILTKHGISCPLVKVYPMESQHSLRSGDYSGVAILQRWHSNIFFLKEFLTNFNQILKKPFEKSSKTMKDRKLLEGLDNVSKVINLVVNLVMWFVRFSVWMRQPILKWLIYQFKGRYINQQT